MTGIIPARAGFTRAGVLLPGLLWDHPRSRGVYGTPIWVSTWNDGSSPLARGLRVPAESSARPDRIIPARAGFTSTRGRLLGRRADHPRSRGVYDAEEEFAADLRGSSPLARGLLGITPVGGVIGGIIPARAGFTERRRESRRRAQDHPRSRGVYLDKHISSPAAWGSSPLARGLRPVGGVRVHRSGIIPARAGFTSKLS